MQGGQFTTMMTEQLKEHEMIKFNFNKKIRLDFTGSSLSSDTGLLAYAEFAHVIGLRDIIEKEIQIEAKKRPVFHNYTDNILQQIFSFIAGYEDNVDADFLRYDSIFKTISNKELASQPTLSRHENKFKNENIPQFQAANLNLLSKAYSVKKQEEIMLDIDSTDDVVHGNQEGAQYNGYYKEVVYHPLFVFDGNTRDCLKGELRAGNVYTSNGVVDFIRPVMDWAQSKASNIKLRGDSGFAVPELYELSEEKGVIYFIRLKANMNLYTLAQPFVAQLDNQNFNAQIIYGEFLYKADSWSNPRRVLIKVDRKEGELFPTVLFVVTNSEEHSPEEGFNIYCGRGNMENFIKEGKHGFFFGRLSCHSFDANAARLQTMILAYNLNNLMRRLCMPEKISRNQIDTLRHKIIKFGCKVVNRSRQLFIKCSSTYYMQNYFMELIKNIQSINFNTYK